MPPHESTVAAAIAATTAAEDEVARQMQICNACRYCEGFCAVFPAMTRRLEFAKADVHYLANLCHSCGACLHACQYAPPHEFAVNVPQAMAKVRTKRMPSSRGRPASAGSIARNGPDLGTRARCRACALPAAGSPAQRLPLARADGR